MSYTRIATTPLTHIGWGAIDHLAAEAEKFNSQKTLVVSDPILKEIGIVNYVTEQLVNSNFDLYTDIIPEPLLETGQQLVDYARNGKFELIIGIGGGSALDLAKLASVFTTNDGSVADYLNLSGNRTLQRPGVPLILIPTTSGTGAEVTNISVLALKNTKDVITHDFLIADVAIVDPQLTVSMPPKVTAATGADAFTHAVEAYISVNANNYSDGNALEAIKLISGALRKAVSNGSDQQARTDMAYGSYLAGLAFFNAGVGAIHALAYPLGGQFHIAHGDSNAVLIPYVMSYIRSSCYHKMSNIYQAMGGNLNHLTPEEASFKCIDLLIDLLNDIGIPKTLQGFNIPKTALSQLTYDGVKQKRLLARCPMDLNEQDIHKIYECAFTGEL